MGLELRFLKDAKPLYTWMDKLRKQKQQNTLIMTDLLRGTNEFESEVSSLSFWHRTKSSSMKNGNTSLQMWDLKPKQSTFRDLWVAFDANLLWSPVPRFLWRWQWIKKVLYLPRMSGVTRRCGLHTRIKSVAVPSDDNLAALIKPASHFWGGRTVLRTRATHHEGA